jgi:hypothetical protein
MNGGSTNRTEFEIFRDGVDDTDESKKRGSIVRTYVRIRFIRFLNYATEGASAGGLSGY